MEKPVLKAKSYNGSIFKYRGKLSVMKLHQLQEFRQEIEDVIQERNALGEYDANAKHMNWLLDQLAKVVDHAISQYPRAIPKGKK
jgi:hypothetical protein